MQAPYAPPDEAIAARLLAAGRAACREAEARIDARATRLIAGIRARAGGLGGIEDFLHAYSLSTREGLALMVLAEALLRVPDAVTADRLIEDKLAKGDWTSPDVQVATRCWCRPRPGRSASRRASSSPARRPTRMSRLWSSASGCRPCATATRQAMRLLGSHFVLGQTIDEALGRAEPAGIPLFVRHAGRRRPHGRGRRALFRRLCRCDRRHRPRAPATRRCRTGRAFRSSSPRCIRVTRRCRATGSWRELVPRLIALARQARGHDLNFTIDAEEADRLELSLDVIAATLADPSLRGWEGFGLAVQAYQKRAPAVIDLARGDWRARYDRRLMVRLVKGAYWDTEVKRAQERGLAGLSGVHAQGDDRPQLR